MPRISVPACRTECGNRMSQHLPGRILHLGEKSSYRAGREGQYGRGAAIGTVHTADRGHELPNQNKPVEMSTNAGDGPNPCLTGW